MIALIQPPKLSQPTFFPFAKLRNAPTGLFLVIRPRADSATIIVYPNVNASMIYTSRKIPPPYFAARYGNLQIFPSPTDAPAADRT